MGQDRGALVGPSREACNRAPLWWVACRGRRLIAEPLKRELEKPERTESQRPRSPAEPRRTEGRRCLRSRRGKGAADEVDCFGERSDQDSTVVCWVATFKTDERDSRGQARGDPERGAPSLVAV